MFLVFIFTLAALPFIYDAYGLWIPQSPDELLKQSQTVFVGNITSVKSLEFAKSSTYHTEDNGIERQVIENYTLVLDEYTTSVDGFLKNPQNSDTVVVRQPTTSIPGMIVSVGGFEIGDRVLFYLEKLDGENTYSPESFEIPKPCDAKSVLSQPRITFGHDMRTVQGGVQMADNFTAGTPIQFVYDIDTRTLEGKSYDFDIGINKVVDSKADSVFRKKIHAEAKPCEWIASAKWEITPQAGKHTTALSIYGDDGDSTSLSGQFFVKDNTYLEIVAPLKQFKSGSQIDTIEFIDGKPFFVSGKYNTTQDPNKVIMFHGIKFTHPVFSDPPAPGGGAFTDVVFPDGTKETLSQVGFLKFPILFTKHTNPQVGMRENQYDTFSILVSADLTKISPLQQFKSGIAPNDIICNDGLQLVLKNGNGHPVCIKGTSVKALTLRNYIYEPFGSSGEPVDLDLVVPRGDAFKPSPQ